MEGSRHRGLELPGRRAFLAALVAGAMVALVGAAPASAEWGHYFTVAGSEQHSYFGTRVDVAPDGDATVLWYHLGGLQVRVREADGELGTIRNIAPPGTVGGSGDAWALAVGSDGSSYVVWQSVIERTDGPAYIRARVLRADGTMGPTQTLASASSGGEFGSVMDPHVGIDDAGRAVFSWIRARAAGKPLLQVRTRSAGGGLGPTLDLGTSAAYSQVAVNPQGRAFFAWEANRGVFARTLSAAGTLGPLLQLSASGSDPQVATGGGSALFGWRQDTGDNLDARIMTREWSPGGTLGHPQVVAQGNVLSGVGQLLAMAPDGTAAYSWWQSGQGETRVRSAQGTLGPVKDLGSDGGFEVGVDANANFVFLGNDRIGENLRVFARTERAGGPLGPIHMLSPPGYNAYSADLGVNAAGDAAAVWYEGARGFAVEGAVGP